MKIKSLICMLLCSIMFVGLFAGCEVIDVNEVLVINGEVVTGGEFNFMLESFKTEIAAELQFDPTDKEKWSSVMSDNRKAIDFAKDKTIDEIVLIWVQAQKAEEEGIALTAEELAYADSNYNALVEQYGGMQAFEKQLSSWQVSKEAVKGIFKRITLATKLQQKYITEDNELTKISEEEIKAQYENEKNAFYDSAIFAKHILILFENAEKGITRTKDEAKAEAQKILDRLNAGEDFEKLMLEYSEDAETSHEGYSFTHNDGQFVREFDDGAYALEIGEISGLVETEYGYHIIKRYPSDAEFEAYEDIKEDLKSIIAYDRYNAMVKDSWVKDAAVEKNTKIIDKIK